MSAIFDSILDKQGDPAPIVLSAEEREALEYARSFMRQKAPYMRTAEQVKRKAAIIESLLARSGSR